jgi:hypothetical protein
MTPSDIEKSRKEFEEFLAENFKMINPDQNYIKPNGEYYYAHAELAFKAWVASRESLVVELPKSQIEFDENDYPCEFFTKKQVTHMLQSAGINYRERE